MKKGFKIIAIMVMVFMSIPCVKAEEDTTTYIYKTTQNNYYNTFNFTETYKYINNSNSTYWAIIFNRTPNGVFENRFSVCTWNDKNITYANNTDNQAYFMYTDGMNINCRFSTNLDETTDNDNTNSFSFFANGGYLLYDTNYNFISKYNFKLTGFYQDDIVINKNDRIPLYKNLIKYNSWSNYENEHLEGYTEVNLDNYEYVLLSLKNYNQTQAFQTNLQVKGQIGITPIYNYGQTSKDSITGAQVQDRCNITYKNYTSYPFYILQTDLQNNVIYAVKECSSGSSFKFDNSIFDITYVTEENKNNPTVTINGKTYDVIPYQDLPSTATKNEEDNYIPGESGQANSTGGLNSAIKNVQQKMSEIWNTFTYFTNFVGQLFSTLPTEVRTILLSGFTIAIILGLIKIFIN